MLDRSNTFRLLRPSDRHHFTDWAVHEDRRGAIWFGGGTRLTRFFNDQLEDITAGFPGDAILSVVDDDQGYLWIATNSGIVHLAPSEFDKAVRDPSHPLAFRFYDASDGLAGMPSRYNNAVRRVDGTLWFVTGRGLTSLEPSRLSVSRPAPAVRIETVNVNGSHFEPTSPLVLPAGATNIQIDYTALTFFSPRKVRFRYLLEGFDESWTNAGTRREAVYTKVPPGSYRFRIAARSSEGIWNEEDTLLDLAIPPTFYQTRSFYAFCVLGAAATALFGWRARMQRVKHHFKLVLAERVRLSREIHDTLLQSLVGVALQLDAASTSIESRSAQDAKRLGQMRDQVEHYIREARQSIWNLRSTALQIADLSTSLREVAAHGVQGTGVKVDFTVTGQSSRCPAAVEQQLLRIGQEAIVNVVRHADAHRVQIELHFADDSVRLNVSDDGRGFDPSARTHHPGQHCGLLIMQERAEQVGGSFAVSSRFRGGTAVSVTIPLSFTAQG